VQRHDNVKKELAKWLEKVGVPNKLEQEAPKWNTEDERAILDIAYHDKNGKDIYIDVSCVEGAEGGSRTPAAFAIQRRERAKHARYNGPDMYPFVLDCRGRWGREAINWANLVLKDSEAIAKAEHIRALRVAISTTLQRAVAEQILCATAKGG
jgi:hypothetical protein